MTSVALAFIRRDFLVMSSYRTAFLYQISGVFLVILILFFVAELVGAGALEEIEGFGDDYFDFLLVGIAFTDVFTLGLQGFSRSIRDGQQSGTLEAMLLCHFRIFNVVLFSSLYSYLLSLFRLSLFAFTAVVVFGFWTEANVLTAGIVFVLASACFISLGTISAAFVLVLKQGDPVDVVNGLLSAVLGSVLFPVTVLPGWVQPLSVFIPLRHALNGMRLALQGASPGEVGFELLMLSGMTALFLPAGVLAFNWAITRAKQEGSLVQY